MVVGALKMELSFRKLGLNAPFLASASPWFESLKIYI